MLYFVRVTKIKMAQKVNQKRHFKKNFRRLFIVTAAVILLFGIFIFGYSIVYAQRVLPKVTVGGIDVSGLSQNAAREQIKQKIAQVSILEFRYNENVWELKLNDLGVAYDLESSLNQAYSLGKTGVFSQRLADYLRSLFRQSDLPLKYTIDKNKYDKVISENIGNKIESKELETQLVVQNLQPKIILGKKGKRIDQDDLLAKTKTYLNYANGQKIAVSLINSEPKVDYKQAENSVNEVKKIITSELKLKTKDREFTLDPNLIGSWVTGKVIKENQSFILTADLAANKVASYVQALAKEINKDPENARITMEKEQVKVLAASVVGQVLKEEETIKLITETLLARKEDKVVNEVNLVIEEKEPEIKTENIANLGIKELIGVAATDFSTSPDNRKHNIAVGANALSGKILKDGEEFSALKQLGKIDAASGYLPELVINNNKLEADYGGGLCQNATTLFRAIMDAGLPITQRQNHSRRVSYYEKSVKVPGLNITFDDKYASIGSSLVGYDATVFIPQPDLKFKNNTGQAILVQEYVSGNVIYAEIYGSKDGRKSSITKAEVLSTKEMPTTIYHDVPSLPKGINKTIVKGAPGAKTKFIYTITYVDGKQESQEFISYYRAIAPEIQVGSQEIAQPTTP